VINSHKAETIRSVNVDVGRNVYFGFRDIGEQTLSLKGVLSSNKKISSDVEDQDKSGVGIDSLGESSDEESPKKRKQSGAVDDTKT
jgi:hypothetical protein